MVRVAAPLQIWTGDDGSSHYLVLGEQASNEIKAHSILNPRGFGSVRVEAAISQVRWNTSVFPRKDGGYFLPVKMAVCRQAGIAPGDLVTVEIGLL